MEKIINELLDESKEIKQRLNEIDAAISALQNICTHTKDGKSAMKHVGHDSHYDIYVCSICKKRIKE